MLTIVNPATGEALTAVESDTPESIKDKTKRAREAASAWPHVPILERIDCIRKFSKALKDDKDRLAAVLTSETGKPIAQSGNELNAMSGRLDFFINKTEATLARQVPIKTGELEERISHEPLGVVANISAWNYPYFVGSNVFVPALLAGNAVLYKPSEFASLTGLEIERLLRKSGVPKDAFQAVIGDAAAGKTLLESDIDAVFFTGSYAAGQKIAEAAANKLLKVQLELGGKDPVYVADDADIPAAAAGLADGAFYNNGQSCCAVERIYVHASVYDVFLESFLSSVRSFKIGEPTDPATYIGPLTRGAQIEVLESQIADAMAKGARVLIGGKRLERAGNYFAPTVLAGVDHSMTVMREESFGPVIGIMKVENDDEAVKYMNDTEYGLTAGIYTSDRERGEKTLARLDAGTVYLNCCDRVSPNLPWSGRKKSGLGLTLSAYGIETFARPKAWHLKP